MKNFIWLALLWYSLYCGGLEPNLQYLQGMSPRYVEFMVLFVWTYFFFPRGSVYFLANYKDDPIHKALTSGTLEGRALGSLLHDFFLSLSWLCLMWEETGQVHLCAFLLVFWPWFSEVFTCISWWNRNPVPGRYSKRRFCPFAFGWKVWSLPETKNWGPEFYLELRARK